MEKFEFGKKEWFSESKKNEFAISFTTWVNSLPEKEEINQDLLDKYKNYQCNKDLIKTIK